MKALTISSISCLIIGYIAFISIFKKLNIEGYAMTDTAYSNLFNWGIVSAIITALGFLLILLRVAILIYKQHASKK